MSRLRIRRASQTASLDLRADERVHVGVDVHKKTYSVAVLSDARGLVATWVQPADPDVLLERLLPVRDRVAGVVYEAGPTGYALARRLRAEGLATEVLALSRMLRPAGPEAKSDRLDCRRLALMAQKGLVRPIRVPSEQEEADRQVLRLREQIVRRSRAAQQQIKSFLLMHGIAEPAGLAHWSGAAVEALRALELSAELRFCLDVMLDELEHAREQVERVTRRLDEVARSARHQPAAAVMRTVPGVGLVTAMTYRLEMPEPERFAHEGQVARFVGLAPIVRESGQTRRGGGLLRSSSARLRRALVEAAWRWVACDESARAVHRRLLGNTGDSKKAIVGVARRLGILLWRLSVRGEPYRAAA